MKNDEGVKMKQITAADAAGMRDYQLLYTLLNRAITNGEERNDENRENDLDNDVDVLFSEVLDRLTRCRNNEAREAALDSDE